MIRFLFRAPVDTFLNASRRRKASLLKQEPKKQGGMHSLRKVLRKKLEQNDTAGSTSSSSHTQVCKKVKTIWRNLPVSRCEDCSPQRLFDYRLMSSRATCLLSEHVFSGKLHARQALCSNVHGYSLWFDLHVLVCPQTDGEYIVNQGSHILSLPPQPNIFPTTMQ